MLNQVTVQHSPDPRTSVHPLAVYTGSDMKSLQTLMTLGRQAGLSRAELESLYGAGAVHEVTNKSVLVDINPDEINFKRLGGSIKAAKVIAIVEGSGWKQAEVQLLQLATQLAASTTPGKIQLGMSAEGFDITPQKLQATGLSIKKAMRKSGRSVRIVTNKTLEMSSAQVYHNRLTGGHGIEVQVVQDKTTIIIAQTVAVQNIDSYAKRDRDRPKRDARVGMLPPKLAQILLNLALGTTSSETVHILDPFCGTGVLLQEALIAGFNVDGTDIEQRMIDYSLTNLQWLQDNYPISASYSLVAADATNYRWKTELDVVASETYLGKPFTSLPSSEVLNQTISGCNLILRKFLLGLAPQLRSGTRLCLAIPAWNAHPVIERIRSTGTDRQTSVRQSATEQHYGSGAHSSPYLRSAAARPAEFRFLPLVDQIQDLGYNRVSFEHASDEECIYFRPDQIVARQLIVLTKQ